MHRGPLPYVEMPASLTVDRRLLDLYDDMYASPVAFPSRQLADLFRIPELLTRAPSYRLLGQMLLAAVSRKQTAWTSVGNTAKNQSSLHRLSANREAACIASLHRHPVILIHHLAENGCG